jgi:DNA-binding transcriptional MerR regulator
MGTRPNSALTSGELGAAAGVSADSVRHYEKLGLLAKPLRTEGGYRLYPSAALLRVQTIRSALKAGFSLAELAGIFKERDAGGTPCRRVAGMATNKIAALDQQIAELVQLREWLFNTVANWNQQLQELPSGRPARLLESLAQARASAPHTSKGNLHESNRSGLSAKSRYRGIRTKHDEQSNGRSAPDRA